MITLTLPLPDKRLSPNARTHYMVKARLTKAARYYAWACMAELKRPINPPIVLTFTFHPKTKRLTDLDNLLASCKAYIDGIAEALCVNDKDFSFVLERGEAVKGGQVVVRVEGARKGCQLGHEWDGVMPCRKCLALVQA